MPDPASQFVTEQSFESLAGVGAAVDKTSGVVRGVKVIGFESKNGRVYPPDLLKRSVHLYEGAKVFVDHTDDKTGRKYQERFGTLKSARFVEGKGIHADHHFNPEHPLAKQYMWDAEHAPDAVGFSHKALLRFAPKLDPQGRKVVEEIGQVLSVDLVAEPATTNGLFESQTPASTEEDPMDLSKLTLEELAKERPDLLKALGDKSADADKIKALETLIAEQRKQLDQYAAERKAAAQEKAISEELKASGLDPANKEHVSDVFLKQLLATEDAAIRKALIEDRAALAKAVPAQESAGSGISTGSSAAKLPEKPVTSIIPGAHSTPSLDRIRECAKDPKKFAALCG